MKINMKAKYEVLSGSSKGSLKAYLQGFWRSAIAFALVVLFVMGGFAPDANAGLFSRTGENLTTKEIQTLVNAGLTGNYVADTTDTIKTLREAINLPENAENRAAVKTSARYKINAYVSRYRADREKNGFYSYTTMLTALNTLAGYYNGTAKRAVPAKVRDRLIQEFDRAEAALAQGR